MSEELFRALVGSQAHGLANPESDHDYRGVFYVPTCELLRVTKGPTKHTSWNEGENDDTLWEIGHFLFLATKCNPTILETFTAPIAQCADSEKEWVTGLRDLFPYIWNPTAVAASHIGYGLNQRKKFLENKDNRRAKYAVAYLRVLYQACELLRVGDLVVNMTDTPIFGTLKKWRKGEFTIGEVVDLTEQWVERVRMWENKHRGNPNYDPEAVDRWLLEFRKAHWYLGGEKPCE